MQNSRGRHILASSTIVIRVVLLLLLLGMRRMLHSVAARVRFRTSKEAQEQRELPSFCVQEKAAGESASLLH